MLAGDKDLSQKSFVLIIKSYLNKKVYFIPKLNSKCVFKYPFHGGKKLPHVECFERIKIAYFLFI